jgi:hypothetical protein
MIMPTLVSQEELVVLINRHERAGMLPFMTTSMTWRDPRTVDPWRDARRSGRRLFDVRPVAVTLIVR